MSVDQINQNGYQAPTSTQSSTDDLYKPLVRQIEVEYQAAKLFLLPKLQKWQRRLKLMNNQRRDEDAIGDVTMFTQFQTILAALYDDQLMAEFKGKNDGDLDIEDNLNHLSEDDAVTMQKPEFDYFWDWNTLFFGRSVLYFTNFSRDRNNTPIPDLVNMLTFLRDSKAVSINGDVNGHNACRFFGRVIEMTKDQMQSNPDYFDINLLRPGQLDTYSLLEQAQRALQDAQGLTVSKTTDESLFGANALYELLEWCTHWLDPRDGKIKKVLCVLGNQRTKIVRMKIFQEEGKLAKVWPVIDRPMYPSSNDWDGTSLPDVIEDKQRMRAVLSNLAIKSVKADLYPSYLYDRKRFKNRADFNLDINKFIPIEGGDPRTAITPMQRAAMNLGLYNEIMQSLQLSAEQATATPEMQQGRLTDERRTLGELNMVQQGVGTRYSLTAKVFGWSEKKFWKQWYRLYKDNFKDHISEKILRIEGAFGPVFRPLTRENIIADVDPDVTIESRIVTDAKTIRKKQDFTQLLQLAAPYPGTNLRYGLKKLGRFTGMMKDEIDRLFPPTVDEMLAEDENVLLSKDKTVYVNANDNHEVHLEVHAKAGDTKAAFAHVEAHKKALELKRDNPALFPQQQNQPQQNGQTPGQPAPAPVINVNQNDNQQQNIQ